MLRSFARGPALRRYASTLAEARQRWNGRLVVTPELEHALETGSPVVALESTIITHGMPYPANLETAQSVESLVRAAGAVPATIALLDGRVHVGLSAEQLSALADPATPRAEPAVKVSRRDIAPTLALRRVGGTTVAGTMVVARSVGIDAFVTGGIGGVHRGAENSMDISADLLELGRTPMMVVCAGAKSILDIPRTLEVLETQGVCVATYSANADFPAFYTPSSGCASPWRVGNVADAANVAYTGLTLPSPQSTLLAVPIPDEYAVAGDTAQAAVEQAVRESVEQGVDKRGKEVTPWLLARVGELTRGTALGLNIKLIENNARVGSAVAVEIARLKKEQHASNAAYVSGQSVTPAMPAMPAASVSAHATPVTTKSASTDLPRPSVLVFGSAAVDITSAAPSGLAPRTTTPGAVTISAGGVGRNIAHAAQNLLPSGEVMLVSPVGQAPGGTGPDPLGTLLHASMAGDGLRTDGLVPGNGSTAACSLLLAGGDLVGGVADMAIAETLDAETAERLIATRTPRVVAFDCNLSPGAIASLLAACAARDITTFCDPTSLPKLGRLVPALRAAPRALTHLSPNTLELDALYAALEDADDDGAAWAFVNALNLGAEWRASVEALARSRGDWIIDTGAATKMVACLPYVGAFWLKAGEKGLLRLALDPAPLRDPLGVAATIAHPVAAGDHAGSVLTLTHFPPPTITPEEVVSTTGAGDTLVGGLVAGLAANADVHAFVPAGIERVGRTLRSPLAVA